MNQTGKGNFNSGINKALPESHEPLGEETSEVWKARAVFGGQLFSTELQTGAGQVPTIQSLENRPINYPIKRKLNKEQGTEMITPTYVVSKCSSLLLSLNKELELGIMIQPLLPYYNLAILFCVKNYFIGLISVKDVWEFCIRLGLLPNKLKIMPISFPAQLNGVAQKVAFNGYNTSAVIKKAI